MPITPAQLRARIRGGEFTSPTAGQAPGYIQANVLMLHAGSDEAKEFAEFAARNPAACPVLTSFEGPTPAPPWADADAGATIDVTRDVGLYRAFKNGKYEGEYTSVSASACVSSELVSFLIGCSFTFDSTLFANWIPVRNIEQAKNVPMYITNWMCNDVGRFRRVPIVCSMRPIPPHLVQKAVRLTKATPMFHGSPLYVGTNYAEELGIADLNKPDFGDALDLSLHPDDVMCFWPCGVTALMAVMLPEVPWAFTHAPGHMLVTDARVERTVPSAAVSSAIECLSCARTILVTAHRAPDGDAIGSVCGMVRVLNRNLGGGSVARIVGMRDTPQSLKFICKCKDEEALDGSGSDVDVDLVGLAEGLREAEKPAVLLMLDSSDQLRSPLFRQYDGNGLDEAMAALAATGLKIVNVDHHQSNTYFGDINVVEPETSSACEVALGIAQKAGWIVDADAAAPLYLGILTDTLSFTLPNTKAATFEAAACLVRGGADAAMIGKRVFRSKTPLDLAVRSRVLSTLSYSHGGRVAYVWLAASDFAELGLVGQQTYEYGKHSWEVPSSIEGVEIAFSVSEHANETGASLRSSTGRDVSVLASHFGGGGHTAASGCTVSPRPAMQFVSELLAEIDRLYTF